MNKTHWLTLSQQEHPYQIVSSIRAKYIRVKLSNKGELSVVIPKGVAVHQAHEFIKSRSDWVEKHLQNLPTVKTEVRPDDLLLPLLGEEWGINYREDTGNIICENTHLHETNEFQLEISGNTQDISLIKEVIEIWCKHKAKPIFNRMLGDIAEEFGFHYKRLSIRAQKTRWGSCSSNKNINLNCKLLFFSPEIVRYVMIHELCHTIEMNHSSRFWSLVEECDPLYKNHRTQLKQLSRDIPI